MLAAPPTGTVTFLFTDIQGSTKLWEQNPDAMRPALARHDQLLHQSIEDNGGYVFKTIGDAFCAAFPTANQALNAALAAQIAVSAEPWELPTPLLVRMALHTGTTEERGGDYFGPPLNRVARLMAAGHGGQTLLSDVTQGLVRDALAPPATLLDLGKRRLKDLGRPEQVFQLQHPSLPAEFPALRSLDNPALPNNLPQQTTSFIGREKQMEEVKALLGKTRLLTLAGSGGSGKTRLSLQVAADLLDGDGDGVWLVELAALTDPALVPGAVAQVLGIKEEPGKPIQQTLVAALKAKRLLIVLDNCEHLVAACASLAADLIRNCPEVHILASSREPLNVAGEQTYRVPTLTLPDPKQPQTVESLSQFEAVRLFIERAQAVQASFAVTEANAPAVAQVCWRLDGIPLAIELAAARVRSLPVGEINTRLDHRFRLLTGGSRTVLPRQQTLRALIDWSYDLLTEAEKTSLCRLSVFAGGWMLDAAERVAAGEGPGSEVIEDFEVLDLLTSLVDKSLVVYEEREDGAARYGLLETVRQYGQERLVEGGGAEEVERRHAGWALSLAEEAEPKLVGPEQGVWLSRLEAEHDNVRASLAWEEQAADGGENGLRLAGALGRFWKMHGYLTEGRQWLDQVLARTKPGAKGPNNEGILEASAARAKALSAAGNLAWAQGDYAEARALYEECLTIHQQLVDPQGIAVALRGLGNVAYRQSDYAEARALHEECLTIRRQLGDPQGIAEALNDLGNVADGQGDYAGARDLYEESLAIKRQLGDQSGIAGALINLGAVADGQGDYAGARALYEEGLTILRPQGHQQCIANALPNLGCSAWYQGGYAEARALYEECLTIERQIGDQPGIAYSLTNLGRIARDEARLSEANGLFTESLILKRQLGTPWSTLYTLEEWAALAMAEGDAARAARLAGAAQAGREAISVSVLPEQSDTHERTLAGARTALGEDAFTAAWEAGRVMTLDEAVEYALAVE